MSGHPRPQGFDRALLELIETIPGRMTVPRATRVDVTIAAHYDGSGILKKLEVSSAEKHTLTA